MLAFMAIVSLWTPLHSRASRERWFSLPNILFLWPVPAVTALTAYLAWRWLEQGRDILPFFAAIVLFLLGYAGLVISVFRLSGAALADVLGYRGRAREPDLHAVGTLPLLPIILVYTGFVY